MSGDVSCKYPSDQYDQDPPAEPAEYYCNNGSGRRAVYAVCRGKYVREYQRPEDSIGDVVEQRLCKGRKFPFPEEEDGKDP